MNTDSSQAWLIAAVFADPAVGEVAAADVTPNADASAPDRHYNVGMTELRTAVAAAGAVDATRST